MARVPLVYESQFARVDEIYQKAASRGATIYNLQRAIAHNPDILRNYMRLGHSVLSQTEISTRQRELTILCVAELVDSEYAWAAHVPLALEAGLAREQIDGLSQWRQSGLFDEADGTLLGYVEAVLGKCQTDEDVEEVFNRGHQHFSEKMIVELAMLIGYYQMTTQVARALGIEIEAQHILSLKQLLGRNSNGDQPAA